MRIVIVVESDRVGSALLQQKSIFEKTELIIEKSFDLNSVLLAEPGSPHFTTAYQHQHEFNLSNPDKIQDFALCSPYDLDPVPEIMEFSEHELSEFNLYFG